MPSPRDEYYMNADFEETKKKVLKYMSGIVDKLGTYIPDGKYDVLE